MFEKRIDGYNGSAINTLLDPGPSVRLGHCLKACAVWLVRVARWKARGSVAGSARSGWREARRKHRGSRVEGCCLEPSRRPPAPSILGLLPNRRHDEIRLAAEAKEVRSYLGAHPIDAMP